MYQKHVTNVIASGNVGVVLKSLTAFSCLLIKAAEGYRFVLVSRDSFACHW